MTTRYKEMKQEMQELVNSVHEGMESGAADAVSDAISSLSEELKPYEHLELAIHALQEQQYRDEVKLNKRHKRGEKVNWDDLDKYDEAVRHFDKLLSK